MKRKIGIIVSVTALLVALALPASAHVVFVDPAGEGEGTAQWVGGGPVPGKGQGLVDSPVGKLPPSHAKGLVSACEATDDNPSVVSIKAPPYFTGCHHGAP